MNVMQLLETTLNTLPQFVRILSLRFPPHSEHFLKPFERSNQPALTKRGGLKPETVMISGKSCGTSSFASIQEYPKRSFSPRRFLKKEYENLFAI